MHETFTGIEGNNAQEIAVQESTGHIVDPFLENLSRSDMAIVNACHFPLEVTRTVADEDDLPGTAISYYKIRAIEGLLCRGAERRDAILDEMYPAGDNGA